MHCFVEFLSPENVTEFFTTEDFIFHTIYSRSQLINKRLGSLVKKDYRMGLVNVTLFMRSNLQEEKHGKSKDIQFDHRIDIVSEIA
jgi:hypothetical protein